MHVRKTKAACLIRTDVIQTKFRYFDNYWNKSFPTGTIRKAGFLAKQKNKLIEEKI